MERLTDTVLRLSVNGSGEDISPGGIVLVPNAIKAALTFRIHLLPSTFVVLYEPCRPIKTQTQKESERESDETRIRQKIHNST
jgi:hypothetical protein